MSRDKYAKQLVKDLAEIIHTDEDTVADLIEKDNVVRDYYHAALRVAHRAYADGILEANYQQANSSPEWDG
jgi:endonuclease III-like uncharacterized protein